MKREKTRTAGITDEFYVMAYHVAYVMYSVSYVMNQNVNNRP